MKTTGQWSWSGWQSYGMKSTSKWQSINSFTWLINLKNAKSLKTMNLSPWLLFFWQFKHLENVFSRQDLTETWFAQPNRSPKISVIWWNVLRVKWKPDKITKRFKTYFLTSSMPLRKIPIVIASWKSNLNCNSLLLRSSSLSINHKFTMTNQNVFFQTLQESSLMNLSINNTIGLSKWLCWFFLIKDSKSKEK